jgi:hypothetical protein
MKTLFLFLLFCVALVLLWPFIRLPVPNEDEG